jgi:hypothetical protein
MACLRSKSTAVVCSGDKTGAAAEAVPSGSDGWTTVAEVIEGAAVAAGAADVGGGGEAEDAMKSDTSLIGSGVLPLADRRL